MKIISIGPAYPLRGGIAKFNESLSENLEKAGNELCLYSYRYQYPSFLFPGKTQFSDEAKSTGLKIKSELHSVNLFSWKRSTRKIIKEKPDLVIIHYWMPFFSVQLNVILSGLVRHKIPVILLAHNLIPHEKQPGTKWLSRRLLSRINGLVCLSESVRKDALDLRKDLPSIVLPHPIYDVYGSRMEKKDARAVLELDPSKHYLLFFGLIRKYKGLDLLLEAMPLLRDKNIHLLVAGEFYGKKDEYMDIVEKHQLKDRIIFSDGYIPDSRISLYFSAADLVVQPYRTATQSGVTQIAYHFGNPMVVTNVGGLPEIVEDGKTGFVAETNPPSIAKAINTYFGQKLEEEFSLNVLRKSAEFSWDKFRENFLAFVKSL